MDSPIYQQNPPPSSRIRNSLMRFLLAAFLIVALWVGISWLMPTRHVAPVRVGAFETRPQSWTLIAAIEANNIKEVKRLLDSGVSPDAVELDKTSDSYEGHSALQTSASWGRLPIVQLLLDRGADINAPNFYGDTALIDAAMSGHIVTVKLLISRGADVNANDDGTTALDYVEQNIKDAKDAPIRNRYNEIANILQQAGAR